MNVAASDISFGSTFVLDLFLSFGFFYSAKHEQGDIKVANMSMEKTEGCEYETHTRWLFVE